MRSFRFALLLLLLIGGWNLLIKAAAAASPEEGDDDHDLVSESDDEYDHADNNVDNNNNYDHDDSEEEDDSSSELLVETNPSYVGPSSSSNKKGEDDNIDNNDDETAGKEKDSSSSKAAIGKALMTSNKKTSRSKQLRKRFLTTVKKHGFKVTLLVAAYAFRREIRYVLLNVVSKPIRDPQTGDIVARQIVPPSPTAILKIAVFVDLMRRLQQQQSSGGGKASPLTALALAGSRGNPLLSMLLLKLLSPSNSAYIPPIQQHYTFETLNTRYKKDKWALDKATKNQLLQPQPHGGRRSSTTTSSSNNKKETFAKLFADHKKEQERKVYNQTVILLEWTEIDTSVSQLHTMRDEVSFLLSAYEDSIVSSSTPFNSSATAAAADAVDDDNNNNNKSIISTTNKNKTTELEVVVLLESPGGSAADYALASEQILRMRRKGIKVTVCVDKVAASGGYMVACTSSPGRLFAAPFAVVGSIGVLGQTVNIHKTLKGWGVEPLVFRGGRDKAPVGLIGEVTREGVAKVQDIVDKTHVAFKRHVATARPILAPRIDELATGDVWLGYDALDVGLVDRLVASDEYVGERQADGALILKLTQIKKPKYPFARPTTSDLRLDKFLHDFTSSKLATLLSDFQAVLGKIADLLQTDNQFLSTLTKSTSVSDLGLSSSHIKNGKW